MKLVARHPIAIPRRWHAESWRAWRRSRGPRCGGQGRLSRPGGDAEEPLWDNGRPGGWVCVVITANNSAPSCYTVAP